MVILTTAEAVLFLPRVLGLFLWLCTYAPIMYRYWRRSHRIWLTNRKYKIQMKISPTENAVIWRARRWFAIGLLLTLLNGAQIAAFLVDLPWLNYEARQLYEVEPIAAPHYWVWCGINPVTYLQVYPSGVYVYLGMGSFAYSEGYPYDEDGGPWQHICGRWWYHKYTNFGLSW